MAYGRLLEVDAFRGLAVCAMVAFHFAFALYFLKGFAVNVFSGFWLWLGLLAGTSFVFLAGVSLSLSFSRGRNFAHFLRRGAGILALGIFITIATFIAFPQDAVIFGILHLIGASIILSFPFLRFKALNIVLGAFLIAAGLALRHAVFSFPWLLPFGFFPQGLSTLDYYPLLPWLGVVLLGIAAGNFLYPKGKRAFKIPEIDLPPARFLAFLGRHSLLVYFAEFPIIYAIVWLL